MAQIPVGDFVVGRKLRFQREAVEGLPFAVYRGLQHEAVFERHQAVRFMRRGLCDVRFQAKRSRKDIAAESDVGEVRQAAQIHPQEHVAARAYGAVGRRVPQHAGRQAGDRKSQRFQRVAEQGIVLEAPSAAAARDHFRLQGIHIERHRPAHQRIQILEGDGRRMQERARPAGCRASRCAVRHSRCGRDRHPSQTWRARHSGYAHFPLACMPVPTSRVGYNAVRSNYWSMNPLMNLQSLEEALQGSKSPVERLRNSQIGPYAFPVVRPEFTNWRDEQRAWKETCALLDQSHHMADLYLDGPDALKVLSDLGVNSFKNFKSQSSEAICRL